jgi:hypothetical protein
VDAGAEVDAEDSLDANAGVSSDANVEAAGGMADDTSGSVCRDRRDGYLYRAALIAAGQCGDRECRSR